MLLSVRRSLLNFLYAWLFLCSFVCSDNKVISLGEASHSCCLLITRARPLAARVIKWAAFFSLFFGVASGTFHQRIAGSIIQDGRRLRSGRQAFCIFYIIISLRKCMVYLWFILLRNGTIPKHYLSRLANQYVVYRYICILYHLRKERD